MTYLEQESMDYFSRIFKGPEKQTNWSKGYDDCIAGLAPQSPCEQYNQGYGAAYKMRGNL